MKQPNDLANASYATAGAAILLLCAGAARAEDYWYVGHDHLSITVAFVDAQSITPTQDGHRTAVVLQVLSDDQTPYGRGKYAKQVREFDCSGRRLTLRSTQWFDEKGAEAGPLVSEPALSWWRTAPRSIERHALDFVCAEPAARATNDDFSRTADPMNLAAFWFRQGAGMVE